jgi:hypothetical protein
VVLGPDGVFQPDGTFVPWSAHDTAALTDAFRRAVLRRVVRRGLFERDDAAASSPGRTRAFTCWAELTRQIFEVDPLRCPACGAAMRIVAVITQRAVIDRMLDHRRRAREAARAPPGTGRHARQTARRVRP